MTVVPRNAISDLASFTSIIQLEINSNQSTWYRGCGSYSHKLQPTLYRQHSINTIEGLMEKESEIIDRFKERCIPHLDRQLVGDWEYLFLMQHHGVPTRLLDWSENPFFALYFAIESAPYKLTGGSPKYSESAAF